jgi:hypothetical protein
MIIPDPPANPTHVEMSDRGFARLPEIPGSYGGVTRVYESSAAEHPHIWLAITEPVDLNEHGICMHYGRALGDAGCDCGSKEAHAHLSIENATALRDQLTWIIDNHYQGAT